MERDKTLENAQKRIEQLENTLRGVKDYLNELAHDSPEANIHYTNCLIALNKPERPVPPPVRKG